MKRNNNTQINKASITIRGARVHNLKNINLTLPRNKLIVVTGVSGSGKSSLAFDTIYSEGQRRFVESLSAYARQFLERMEKPDVDRIDGLSPAIAIEQTTPVRNPRSTVGTTTEIYDYLRLLFARIGKTYCSNCGRLIKRDSTASIIEELEKEIADKSDYRLYIMFPIHVESKAKLQKELEGLKKKGFIRILIGEELIDISENSTSKTLLKNLSEKKIYVVVDRIIYNKSADNTRLKDSIEIGFRSGDDRIAIKILELNKLLQFSQKFECPQCNIKYEEPDPRLFSFTSPYGACPTCQGFGRTMDIDLDLVIPDKTKTIAEGAIQPWTTPKWKSYLEELLAVADNANIRVDVPIYELTEAELNKILDGWDNFEGIYGFFKYIESKSYKVHYRYLLSRYRGYTTCSRCKGSRLRKEALNVRIDNKTIFDIVQMTIDEAYHYFSEVNLSEFEKNVANRILGELRRRLKYLTEIGVGYLTLDRLANTLSGGETQRLNLATSLGSSLVGALYVLDEPSIGLHQRDIHKLISVLKSIRDIGNTVLVVEHDAEMMKASDQIVDMGPGAGENGGEVVFQGSYDEILSFSKSLTGKYLGGKLKIPLPKIRRTDETKKLHIRGASSNNIKGLDLEIPLNKFVCVTGVSGSGKSTLVMDILYPALKRIKESERSEIIKPSNIKSIEGYEYIDGVELVDQSPIGRSPRSNPVTYIKVFELIRNLFASTRSAKMRGYTPGSFSFNVPAGRCDACEGSGIQIIEMQFLADLQITCDVCKGKRFKKEILEIKFHEKNINDVLNMTVREAMLFFATDTAGKKIVNQLKILEDVGLGYIRLGQPATTLSGGEAQRIKLAAHLLAKEQERKKLFIFDEPTTGLHFDDIAKLLRCFERLLMEGHSLIVIEHNLDVVKCADWIIDLGPEAGDKGGKIVAVGTPEQITNIKESYTGIYLKNYLN